MLIVISSPSAFQRLNMRGYQAGSRRAAFKVYWENIGSKIVYGGKIAL